jgi:hypothetical protein
MRQIYLLNNDISQYVITVADIVLNIGDFGQLTINDLTTLQGDNTRRFWDKSNPASPFYGARELSNYEITIYNDDVLVFTGVIQSLQADNDNKTATITLKSYIQLGLEKGLIYASSAATNPAIMIQEICSLYKIDIDGSSFGRASSIYETDLVRTSALFKNQGKVLDGIQNICEIGIARVYSQFNKLYIDVYDPSDSDSVFTLSDKSYRDSAVERRQGVTLLGHPNINTVEKEPINGYNIQCVGGVGGLAAVFGDSTAQGKSIDGSYNSPVRIMNLQSAVWIGERWVSYFANSQYIINCKTQSRYGKSIQLGFPIGIQYRGSEYSADIISLNNSLLNETAIGAMIRT